MRGVGRQCQDLQKKVKSLQMIYSCHEKADDCLDILTSMFFKSIFLRSEKFQMYRSSPGGSGGPFLSAVTWSLAERGGSSFGFQEDKRALFRQFCLRKERSTITQIQIGDVN